MSEAPAVALQKAIYDTTLADVALKTAMGGAVRAYDRVPPNATPPYITIGEAQLLDNGDTCEEDRFEAFCDLQVWSRTVGSVECKTVAHALRAALHNGLSLAAWTATVVQCQSMDFFTDPDGLTARARMTFRILLEPA